MSEIEISGDAAPTFPQATAKIDGEEYVLWAYRLLLGREPESRDVIRNNPFKNNRQGLVNTVLRSEEFHTKNRGLPPLDNPYHSWDDEAIAFIHLPKTGGTTLSSMLAAHYPAERTCPQTYNALHNYTPAELARFNFFFGHFDYFATCFIPKRRILRISIFRDPVQRLISFYRFSRSFSLQHEFSDNPFINLANELDVEEFFEHELITSSYHTNNAYLFFFGSSIDDSDMLAKLDKHVPTLDGMICETSEYGVHVPGGGEFLAEPLLQATQRILALDGIGLTERFRDSVELIFSQLGLAMPESIAPTQVTDDLPNSDTRFVPVPKVVMTPRLSRVLEALTRYDRIIYDVAKREFQRRLSARVLRGRWTRS
jgi:hypothetical protein